LTLFDCLLISLAGWLNQQQQDALEYLQEENRVLREQLGGKRLRFSDDQRRRSAVRAKKLGWRMLHQLTTIVTPSTLLAWPRRLIARNMMAASSEARPGTSAHEGRDPAIGGPVDGVLTTHRVRGWNDLIPNASYCGLGLLSM
jgi:hypothetical protein